MNNNNMELVETLENLTKAVREKKNKAENTTRLYAIIYGILVIFVIAYTSIIFAKIKEYATPDAVSAIVKNKIKDSLPGLDKALLDKARKNAPFIADKAVEAVNDVIPKAEDMIKDVINQNTKLLIAQIKTDIFPQFLKVLRDNEKPISESAKAISDEYVAKELAKTLADDIKREIDNNVICYELFQKLSSVTNELDKIVRKPANELTAKEAAERKIIVNWIFLVKKGDTFNGIINNPSVRKFKFFWEDVIDGIIPENIKTDLDATMKPGN